MFQSTSLPNDALQCDLIGPGDHVRHQFLVFIFFLTRALFAVPDRRKLGYTLFLHQYSNKSHPIPFVMPAPLVTRVANTSDFRSVPLVSNTRLHIRDWVNQLTNEGTLLNIIPDVLAVVPSSTMRLTVNPAVSSVAHDSQGRFVYESAAHEVDGKPSFKAHCFAQFPSPNSQTIHQPDVAALELGSFSIPWMGFERIQIYRVFRLLTDNFTVRTSSFH